MSDEQLRLALKGSAMMRAQVSGLRRNVRTAGANAQAATALEEDSR
jgi:hypothetical protein